MMSETAAMVWERSALGKASVSWPSCSKVTPPGPTPCSMRRWITSVGRTVPVPGHYRPAHAPHPEFPGHRDHLRTIPSVGNAEELGQGARGVVDGILAR